MLSLEEKAAVWCRVLIPGLFTGRPLRSMLLGTIYLKTTTAFFLCPSRLTEKEAPDAAHGQSRNLDLACP